MKDDINLIVAPNKYCLTLHNMVLDSFGDPIKSFAIIDPLKIKDYSCLEDKFTFNNYEE